MESLTKTLWRTLGIVCLLLVGFFLISAYVIIKTHYQQILEGLLPLTRGDNLSVPAVVNAIAWLVYAMALTTRNNLVRKTQIHKVVNCDTSKVRTQLESCMVAASGVSFSMAIVITWLFLSNEQSQWELFLGANFASSVLACWYALCVVPDDTAVG
jgi:hypothetical protein